MRKILFRCKRIDNGEWAYGYVVLWGDGSCSIEQGDLEHPMVAVERNTVGLYTGLCDKNGKKIFEGDICRNTKTGEVVSVKWHGTMAGFVWSKPKEGHLFDFGALFRAYDKYEVIGNIHDNPELLEG